MSYMTRCPDCGITPSEIGEAYARAKKMLLDGDLGDKRKENREEKGGRS